MRAKSSKQRCPALSLFTRSLLFFAMSSTFYTVVVQITVTVAIKGL